MKRILGFILALVMVCLPLAGTVQAQELERLTMDRVVQINENQLVVEFSGPVAINVNETNSDGPFAAIRVVTKSGGVLRADDFDTSRVYLQWRMGLQYVDEKHDRLLCTISTVAWDVDNITDILNFAGPLADYADRNAEVRFVMEEKPADASKPYQDCGVCNVTSPDGSLMLFPNYIGGYESAQLPIEVDFNYDLDLSRIESVQQVEGLDADTIIMRDASEIPTVTPEPDVITKKVVRNDPLVMAAVLGGGAVLGVLIVVITCIATKKRKAGK